MSEKPAVTTAVQIGVPAMPRLVKIWITPLAASVPYSVVADAPLITSIRSMSSAAMSWSGEMDPRELLPVEMGELYTRTPSM